MDLTIKQRFAVASIYQLLIITIGFYLSKNWEFVVDSDNKLNSLLIVVALSMILSSYVTEPFFSKPVDVIARWVAIWLFIVGQKDKSIVASSSFRFWVSIAFTASALLLIFLHRSGFNEKIQRVAVDIICTLSRPEYVFTVLYFDIVTSSFRHDLTAYPILIGFGFLLLINKPIVWLVKWLTRLLTYISIKQDKGKYIGYVIGHESTDFFNVEIEPTNSFRQKQLKGSLVYLENSKSGVIAIVFDEKILVGKKWLQVASLRDDNNNLVSFDLKSFQPLTNERSIFSKTNAVYLLDIDVLSEEQREVINSNPLKKQFENLIGYVWKGSTIKQIKFQKLFDDEFLKSKGIGEGTIICTKIGEEEVLYQIIDGKTDEESLEFKDTHGFTVGTAQKLGKYLNEDHELNTVKWLPEIFEPIFLLTPNPMEYIPSNFIGRLPQTDYGIPIKNIDELVTHNSAILGILGIGKSRLTFELLKKIIDNTTVKIICIDITNEYQKADKLPKYVNPNLIVSDSENIFNQINATFNHIEVQGAKQIPEDSGNKKLYQKAVAQDLHTFLFNANAIPADFAFSNHARVRVFNPDYHKASQGEKIGFNVLAAPLTQAEKTRIIAEEVFKIAMRLPIDPDGRAKLLLVFEEAHSLIPEWNSVSNDGDRNATNGTAKVILQGRKYGLGSMVITQRTANISKSILNQCNTIFAMRVFDDTGKQFLENYIGSDYANVLPTLEERSCIAIGKAMKLKQPIIIRLNEMDDIMLPPAAENNVGA